MNLQHGSGYRVYCETIHTKRDRNKVYSYRMCGVRVSIFLKRISGLTVSDTCSTTMDCSQQGFQQGLSLTGNEN